MFRYSNHLIYFFLLPPMARIWAIRMKMLMVSKTKAETLKTIQSLRYDPSLITSRSRRLF